MNDFGRRPNSTKSVQAGFRAAVKTVRDELFGLIGFLKLQYRPDAGQVRWAAFLIIGLIVFQLFRVHRDSSVTTNGNPIPAELKCDNHVQVGGEDGRVICLDAGIEEFAAAGLPRFCEVELARKTLSSGDRISWRLRKNRDGGFQCSIQLFRMSPAKLALLDVVLDLNKASREELESIPGLGPKTSLRIVNFRNKHGPFRDVAGLLEVEGIGNKFLEKIRKRLYCGDLSNPMEQQ